MPSMPPSFRAIFAVVVSLVLLAVPAAARAEPPTDDPAGRECDPHDAAPFGYRCALRSAYLGLLVSGGVVAALGDVIAFITLKTNNLADPVALIPVAGPFIATATHKDQTKAQSCANSDGWSCVSLSFGPHDFSQVGYIAAGILQTVGVALMASSAAVRKRRLERITPFTLTPVPMVSPTAAGLGFSGTF